MRGGNAYTLFFIVIIAAVCSLVLATASQSLKKRQLLAQEADMKRNILSAVGIRHCPLNAAEARKVMSEKDCTDVQCCYREFIRSFTINHRGETVVKSDVPPERIDLERELDKPVAARRYPVFARIEKNRVVSYCVPVFGKGLWSSIYGFIALENDLATVAGLSFYRQGETPGLGAEIQSRWFQESFRGKNIYNAGGRLVSITVIKGKVEQGSPVAAHQVDGISGATLTGNGVTALLKKSLDLYRPFFDRLRKKGGVYGIQ